MLLCLAVGQDAILRRVANPPGLRRLPIGAQVRQPALHSINEPPEATAPSSFRLHPEAAAQVFRPR